MVSALASASVACFALAAACAGLAAVLFFMLDIRSVYGELSGKTATQAISNIHKNGATGRHRGSSLASLLGDDSGAEAGQPQFIADNLAEAETNLLSMPTTRESGEDARSKSGEEARSKNDVWC
jgi:hypothetical protein